MPIYVRDSSTWRHLNEITTNDSGTPRRLTELHAHDGGTWRRVHRGNPIIRVGRGPTETTKAFVSSTNVAVNHKPTGQAWTLLAGFSTQTSSMIDALGSLTTGFSVFRLYLNSFVGDVRPTGFNVNDVVGMTLKTADGSGNIFSVGPETPSFEKGYNETTDVSGTATIAVWGWLESGGNAAAIAALNALDADGGNSVDRMLEIRWGNVTP